ncbi:MAG: ribosome-binding factor A [Planctomycetota bacterium]|jgi:ribosome-binding factor A
MASPQRVSRIQGQMLREVSNIVMHMKDPRVERVNVCDVEITRDLSLATIYFSLIGSEEEQQEAIKALRKASGHIRSQIAQRIQLRYAPELRIEYDQTAERAARVISLIDDLGGEQDEKSPIDDFGGEQDEK